MKESDFALRAAYLHPNVRHMAFAIALPEDFTCWHSRLDVCAFEIVPTILVTDRARQNGDESWSTAEIEKMYMAYWNEVVPKLQFREFYKRRAALAATVDQTRQGADERPFRTVVTGNANANEQVVSPVPLAGRPFAIRTRPLDMTRIRRLSPRYVAAFFDAEGNLGVTNAGDLFAKVKNTELMSIRLIAELFGGSLDQPPYRPPDKVCYRWMASDRMARRFLKKILPYLVIKANRAWIGVCYDIWKEDHDLRRKGADRNDILVTRQAVIELFHKMNKRGTTAIYTACADASN